MRCAGFLSLQPTDERGVLSDALSACSLFLLQVEVEVEVEVEAEAEAEAGVEPRTFTFRSTHKSPENRSQQTTL